jgi:hypothetical protein
MLKLHSPSMAATGDHGADSISDRETEQENKANRNNSGSHISRPFIKE